MCRPPRALNRAHTTYVISLREWRSLSIWLVLRLLKVGKGRAGLIYSAWLVPAPTHQTRPLFSAAGVSAAWRGR
jgi:hypothetical protein